jgi:hypothetical protein
MTKLALGEGTKIGSMFNFVFMWVLCGYYYYVMT